MGDGGIDLDALIGAWRAAFEAAEAALRAVQRDHDLPPAELGAWFRRLSQERVATAQVLGALAGERHVRPILVRLVATPREAKQLLGLPAEVTACVFNVDGVLVPSATVHADAWQETFDGLIALRVERTGGTFAPFSRRLDYAALVHGRSREEAVRVFLASRGISLPEGRPDDPPGTETVHGVANAKVQALLRRLERHGVGAYAGARLYLQLAQDARVPCAVVSGSTHAGSLLESAGLAPMVADCVDGRTAAAEGLRRKPAPDMLLAACRHLHLDPSCTAVFEAGGDGVEAGRSGGFGLVVAVDQDGDAAALRERGADLVVTDLGELLERQLTG
jgi:beta-phosphoglucomutase-like phosphatase (HAD superfamily)